MKALAAFVGLLLVAGIAAAAGFESTPPLKFSRTGNSATLLRDGRVLVAGGAQTISPLASTELYDPRTQSWSAGPSLHTERRGHTATALPDGRVLVAGGALATTFEIYDPSSGTWIVAGNIAVPRENHTASLLADGRVLLAGGLGSSPSREMSHAEIYDPATGISTATGPMTIARTRHTATVLADGRVLVVGGAVQVALSGLLIPWRVEIYDPTTGTSAETGTLVNLFDGHAATQLANGNVLVVGGYEPDTARIYDVAAGDFRPAASLHNGRSDHTATLLANGKVLVAHGYNYTASQSLTVAELYDPASDSWSDAGWAFAPRFDSTATRLANDLVLFAGGNKTAGESELNNPLPPACLIQFASSTFRVNENAGAFELPVVRTGYCAGYTSVRFQACTGSGETATPNADYAPTGPRRYSSTTTIAHSRPRFGAVRWSPIRTDQ